MRFEVTRDLDWANRHIPAIDTVIREIWATRILRVRIATREEDERRATDMVVMETAKGPIALRVRSRGWFERIGDFTIRAWRRGMETELDKIRKGIAPRWFFYCWSEEDRETARLENPGIIAWLFVDISKIPRSAYDRKQIANPDQRTGFIPFTVPELKRFGALVEQGGEGFKKMLANDARIRKIFYNDRLFKVAGGYVLEDQLLDCIREYHRSGVGLVQDDWLEAQYPDHTQTLSKLEAEGLIRRKGMGWQVTFKGQQDAS